MDYREELLAEAKSLELDFPKNIPTEKLERLVEEAKGPSVKPDEEDTEQDIVAPEVKETSKPMSKRAMLRKRIAESKKKAMKTRIVTLTNKDNRENDVMTTAHLSFENQHFGLSKIVPLDVPVELEQALIDIAESTRITLHKDEIVSGKRTGNRIPVSVKKFAISYSQRQTEE